MATSKLIACLIAAAATVAVLVGVLLVGKGAWNDWSQATCMPSDCFTEAIAPGAIRQPVNAITSFGFLLVAFGCLADQVRKPTSQALIRTAAFNTAYAYSVLAIGLGSFFYHSSLTFAGQVCDILGMYVLLVFIIVFRLVSAKRLDPRQGVAAFLTGNGVGLAVQIALPETRRFLFALLVFAFLGAEMALRREPRRFRLSYLFAAIGSLGVGFLFWIPDRYKLIFDPHSLVQGHALWHLLGALAAWFTYLYFRSELPDSQAFDNESSSLNANPQPLV